MTYAGLQEMVINFTDKCSSAWELVQIPSHQGHLNQFPHLQRYTPHLHHHHHHSELQPAPLPIPHSR